MTEKFLTRAEAVIKRFGEITGNYTSDFDVLRGSHHARDRVELMEIITGEHQTRATSGINALTDLLVKGLGIDTAEQCRAAVMSEVREKIRKQLGITR
jgi:hypothetical protein